MMVLSMLNYMNEHFHSKYEPATNGHHYRITNNQYNEETHNIYKIYKTNTCNIKNNRYTDEHYYKQTNVNNSVTNNISKTNMSNNEHLLNIQKYRSSKKHISNNYTSHIVYIGNMFI